MLGNKGGDCHMCEISRAGIKFSTVKVTMKGLCPCGSQIKTKETLNTPVSWKTDIFTHHARCWDPDDKIIKCLSKKKKGQFLFFFFEELIEFKSLRWVAKMEWQGIVLIIWIVNHLYKWEIVFTAEKYYQNDIKVSCFCIAHITAWTLPYGLTDMIIKMCWINTDILGLIIQCVYMFVCLDEDQMSAQE